MCAASRSGEKDPYSEVESLWRSVRDYESLEKAPCKLQPWRAELLEEPETDPRCRPLQTDSGSSDGSKIYEIDAPGEGGARAYIWPGALGEGDQRDLIFRTLRDWAKPPNRSNLWPPPDASEKGGPSSTLTKCQEGQEVWLEKSDSAPTTKEDQGIKKEEARCRRPEDFDSATATPSSSSSASPNKNEVAQNLIDALGAFLVQDPIVATDNTHGSNAGGAGVAALVERLRWVVLGQQYDWSTRTYLPEDAAPPLPTELRSLASEACKHLQRLLGDNNLVDMSSTIFDAAICNFYHAARRPSDRLGGHRDDVEADAVSPLVTVSLGLPCVFLLGGATREARPIPLLLRSGTLLILAGPARHLYHGVPTVLVPPPLQLKGRSPKRLKSALPPRLAAIYRGSALPGHIGGLQVSFDEQHALHGRANITGEGQEQDSQEQEEAQHEQVSLEAAEEAIEWLLARARMSFSIRSVGD